MTVHPPHQGSLWRLRRHHLKWSLICSKCSVSVRHYFIFLLSLWMIILHLSFMNLSKSILKPVYCSFFFRSLFFLNRTFFFKIFILFGFLNFWLCWVFIPVHRLSLVVANGGYSSLRCMGFSLQWLLLLQSMATRWAVFSSCGSQAQ